MLRIEVPAADAEVAADALWAAGASAVGEDPRGGAIVLTADLDACPPPLASWPHTLSEDDGRWWDGWRIFARAVVAGPFFVRPPWVEAEAPPGTTELVVDAGRAFGTGSHPSTTLALRALAAVLPSPVATSASVLDAGCGSGALAIGAARLGARRVVAVDVDPAAVEAMARNAERNGVADRIEVAATSVADLRGETFDVVVANLGLPGVVDLAAALSSRCRPDGGHLVLSGMLDAPGVDERIVRAYPDTEVVGSSADDGWRCLVLRRADPHGAIAHRSGANAQPSRRRPTRMERWIEAGWRGMRQPTGRRRPATAPP